MVIPFCLDILIIHGMTLKNHSIIVEPWQSMFKSSLSHGFSPWIFSLETPFVPYGAMGIPQFQSQKRCRFAEELLRRFFSFGTPVVIASEEPKRKLDFVS